jgi:hypothetical protein
MLLFIGSYVSSCTVTTAPEGKPMASVGEKILSESELSNVIPSDLAPEDSALIALEYIKKWVRQELMIQKANENLSPEQKNLSKEIDEYRNSLIIYKYKNALLSEQLDTAVTTQQIEQYYYNNADNFRLNSNIVKGVYVKIKIGVAKPGEMKKMVADNSPEGMIALREYCLQHAESIDVFTEKWIDFKLLRAKLPNEIENPKEMLMHTNIVEQKDDNYYYIANIHDYQLQNGTAPIEYVSENIKNLILNKRKIEFLQQVEENVYKEGLRQNKFKIYTDTGL